MHEWIVPDPAHLHVNRSSHYSWWSMNWRRSNCDAAARTRRQCAVGAIECIARSGALTREQIKPLLVVVDELAAIQLRRRGEDTKAMRDRRDRMQGALGEIALMGRAASVHLLAIL